MTATELAQKPVLTPKEAAVIAGVSSPTIIAWCEGRLKNPKLACAVRVGSRWKIPTAGLLRALNVDELTS